MICLYYARIRWPLPLAPARFPPQQFCFIPPLFHACAGSRVAFRAHRRSTIPLAGFICRFVRQPPQFRQPLSPARRLRHSSLLRFPLLRCYRLYSHFADPRHLAVRYSGLYLLQPFATLLIPPCFSFRFIIDLRIIMPPGAVIRHIAIILYCLLIIPFINYAIFIYFHSRFIVLLFDIRRYFVRA